MFAVVLCATCSAAQAQDTRPPGLVATLDFTQRLEYSDNPDLEEDGSSDFFGRTILDFGLESETSLETFSFNLGTDIEEGREDESSVNFDNSFARLNYDRTTRSASIGLSARYRETDTNSSFFEDGFPGDGNTINQDSGTRETFGFGLRGAVGIDAPIGGSWDIRYNEINYSGTNDPDLTDENTLDATGRINFRIDPRITTRLTARYIDFDAQGNGVNRETTGLGVGAVLDITPLLRGDFEIRYDSIDRSGDEVGTDDGVSFSADLTQQTQSGFMGVTLRSDVTSNDSGRRNFLRFNHALELSRGAELTYALGGTNSDDTDFDPLFDVGYSYSLPTSRIRFGLSQEVNTDSDNEEAIFTSVSASYDHQVNSLSTVGLSLNFFDRNELGNNPDDGQRIDLSLTYRYALTRDWGLVGGYTYRRSNSDTDDDRTSNTVFVGLQRAFSWTR